MTRQPCDRRRFLRRGLAGAGLLALGRRLAQGMEESVRATGGDDPDFAAALRPAPFDGRLMLGGWYVWNATIVRSEDGTYHRLYSRWPRKLGYKAWATSAEAAHATGTTPFGPWTDRGAVLAGRGGDAWDAHCIHASSLLFLGGKYYLYYTGARGSGPYADGRVGDEPVRMDERWWNYRNNERVGVAVADRPSGPWKRQDRPVIDVEKTPGALDYFMTGNAAVTTMPDGRILMMYKAAPDGQPATGARVVMRMAVADHPLGPFRKHPGPVMPAGKGAFAFEDPTIWRQGDRYYAMLKDERGGLTGTGGSVGLAVSGDGLEWRAAGHPLVSRLEIRWENGIVQKLRHLERPQVLLENGRPKALYVAYDWDEARSHSANVAVPLEWPAAQE